MNFDNIFRGASGGHKLLCQYRLEVKNTIEQVHFVSRHLHSFSELVSGTNKIKQKFLLQKI